MVNLGKGVNFVQGISQIEVGKHRLRWGEGLDINKDVLIIYIPKNTVGTFNLQGAPESLCKSKHYIDYEEG